MKWILVLLSMVSMVLAVVIPRSDQGNYVVYVENSATCQFTVDASNSANSFINFLYDNKLAIRDDYTNARMGASASNKCWMVLTNTLGACIEAKVQCKKYAGAKRWP